MGSPTTTVSRSTTRDPKDPRRGPTVAAMPGPKEAASHLRGRTPTTTAWAAYSGPCLAPCRGSCRHSPCRGPQSRQAPAHATSTIWMERLIAMRGLSRYRRFQSNHTSVHLQACVNDRE
eukprot:4424809-Prymnesium_polylepis.1